VKNLSTFETGTNSSTNKWVTGIGGADVTCELLAGKTYIVSFTTNYSGSTAQGQLSCKATDNTDINSPTFAIGASCILTFTPAKNIKTFGLYINEGGVTVTNFMICPKSLYDADPSYQPYALSNAELIAGKADLAKTVMRGDTYVANTTKTYALTAAKTYLISVVCYNVAGLFLAFKYSTESTPRLFPVYKTADFDNYMTVSAMADSSNIQISSASSSTWYYSNIAML
jgi:hypothetical protein